MGLGDHPETYLLKALFCQRSPSWLKVVVVVVEVVLVVVIVVLVVVVVVAVVVDVDIEVVVDGRMLDSSQHSVE